MLEASVDGFGGSVAGAGAVEVGQDVLGSLLQGPAQGDDLDQRCRDAGRGLVDEGLQPLLRSDRPPRVFRLAPSRRLEPMMLDFRSAGLAAMLAQGARDAESFLSASKLL